MSLSSSNISRPRSTCMQCRVRKVRCDRRENGCLNCERLKFDCSFQRIAADITKGTFRHIHQPPERRRAACACLECRTQKIRCSGEKPSCRNCIRRGRQCNYVVVKKSQTASDSPSKPGMQSIESPMVYEQTPGRSYTPLKLAEGHDRIDTVRNMSDRTNDFRALSLDETLELLKDYFRHLYALPSYAFLHETSLLQRCSNCTLDESLRLAICAITALKLQYKKYDSSTITCWIQKAEELILDQLDRPSAFHLQALLLVIHYRIEAGDFRRGFMLAGLASRSAFALRLNYEHSKLSFPAQEVRRRVFWSLFLLDHFFCIGLREFELCPSDIIHLQLPCREERFEEGLPVKTGHLQWQHIESPKNVGPLSFCVRLISIRREIMRLWRQVCLFEVIQPSLKESISNFSKELQQLYTSLAPEDRYSITNLVNCKWVARYLLMHLSWHQCHCDLYRIFLSGYKEAAPSRMLEDIDKDRQDSMQRQCLKHAEDIIQIIFDFMRYHKKQCLLEYDTVICAYHSVRLILFMARKDQTLGTSSMVMAIGKAQLVLNMITKFFPHSALVEPMQKDLERIITQYTPEMSTPDTLKVTESDDLEEYPSDISQDASSRQKLAIHSLLLRADFVDDSDQIAESSFNPKLDVSKSSNTRSRVGKDPSIMTSAFGQTDDLILLDGTPENVARSTWNHQQGYNTGMMYTDVELFSSSSQEPINLLYNPWMGFPETADLYGFSDSIDEEYI